MKHPGAQEHIPSILVASLSTAFGVCLLQVTAALTSIVRADRTMGGSERVGTMLTIVAMVFIVIAIYVGAIVTANTFATIIAGRTRTIALLRLLGSSASTQRRAVAREGLMVGVVGAFLGSIIATGLTAAGLALLVITGNAPALAYDYAPPTLVLPVAAVVVTTWLASWVGSRRVLTVSPIEATGAAEDLSRDAVTNRKGRNAIALTLFVVGIGVLVTGMIIGHVNSMGVLVSVLGGVLSFTGLVLGAHLIMPPALRLGGRLFGRGAPARLAAENAVRYPERSSRTTIGLVIGVTLVTMFAVAIASLQSFIHGATLADPTYFYGVDEVLTTVVIICSILTGFSALIAAVGMVNNLSLSVLQRTREIGLLRALGFTARQVRQMIVVESAQLTTAAVLVGLVLGTFYGWAGIQSMFGSISPSGLITPPFRGH
jgi:putative ABC transport system permease protein